MPYSKEHKKKSREKILNSAFKLFATQGFEKTSIDEIMLDAGLTRGGFYSHFTRKSDLYRHSLITGAHESALLQQKPKDMHEIDWLTNLIDGYISDQHIKQHHTACPLAFLATDVAVSNNEVRQTYSHLFKQMNKLLSEISREFNDCKEEDIYAVLAMMIGAVTIGRCIVQDTVRKKLLDGSRKFSQAILCGELALPQQDSTQYSSNVNDA